ncbi:hypothetical protein PVAND_017188 [Polypedilum vanderplanki]|uniref:Uncharacterized protein n=1 Tax=Polypedilum vanderplanki TaxID=319348 RepID=A0A9J6BHI9_POLVA|nr:hypothetical protein PVAND_017188 [Polypedilum vanderplanki]
MTQKKFLHYLFIAILILAIFDGSDAQNDTSSGNSSDINPENVNSTSNNGIDPKYITDPDSCPSEVFINNDDRFTCCHLLNKKRASFRDCCEYPQLMLWRWQYDLCVNQFSINGQEPSRCNLINCCFQYMGILTDNVPRDGINKTGFEFGFLLSVQNNTKWVGPIKESVNQCFRLNYVPPPIELDRNSKEYKDYWDCYEQIPLSIYNIIDCSFDYNFYYCPDGIFKEEKPGCILSKQYVHDCFIDGVFYI